MLLLGCWMGRGCRTDLEVMASCKMVENTLIDEVQAADLGREVGSETRVLATVVSDVCSVRGKK